MMENQNYKNAVNFVYWINDYRKYNKQERTFNSKYLPIYKYGSVVEINLGYRVGSEFGGLHYGIVVNKNDTKSNPVLSVIPIKSFKGKVHPLDYNMGHEFPNLFAEKFKCMMDKLTNDLDEIDKELSYLESRKIALTLFNPEEFKSKHTALKVKHENTLKMMEVLKNHKKRIQKLNLGSIAIPSQILTIDKMRINDPTNIDSTLYDITLSEETMKNIEKKFKELFF